jgi:hypothetical protein
MKKSIVLKTKEKTSNELVKLFLTEDLEEATVKAIKMA